MRRHVAGFRARRPASRARRRARLAASSPDGTWTGGRAPARIRRASVLASRRGVLTRAPAVVGIQDGAPTQQTGPCVVRERERQEPPGPAA